MAAVDPADGILKWGNDDVVTPFSTKMNAHLDSVGSVTNALSRRAPYFVANESARTSLVSQIGAANITQSNPLLVWRANAPLGKNLEYSINGGSSWPYYTSSAADTPWINIPLASGVQPRVSEGITYTPQVRRDASGMVHFRGAFQLSGSFTATNTVIGTIPNGFRPSTEQRFLAFETSWGVNPWGGYIVAANAANPGNIAIQTVTRNNPQWPKNHFTLVVAPWEAA